MTRTGKIGGALAVGLAGAVLGAALAAPGGGNGNGRGGNREEPPPDPAVVYIDSRNGDLMVMNADGSNTRALIRRTRGHPAISADGSCAVVAAEIDGIGGLWVVNTDGSGLRLLTPVIDNDPAGIIDPAISPAPAPDGMYKVAFLDRPTAGSDFELYLINLDGTGYQRMTTTPSRNESRFSWSADATRLAVTTVAPDEGLIILELAVADGTLQVVGEWNAMDDVGGPLAGPLASASFHAWANTQDLLAVSVLVEGDDNPDLFLIDLAQPEYPLRLTDEDRSQRWPSFTPDDSKLVFHWSTVGIVEMPVTGGSVTVLNQHGTRPDARRVNPN